MDTFIDKDKKRIDDLIMNLNSNIKHFTNLVINNAKNQDGSNNKH